MSYEVDKLTKLQSGFEYIEIPKIFSEGEIISICDSLRQRFAIHTKPWSKEANTEWVVRMYLAVKMILSSNVMLTSLEYAMNKNLKFVAPYLLYYSLLIHVGL